MNPFKLPSFSLEAKASEMVESCKNNFHDWRRCYMNQFYDFTQQNGIDNALKTLNLIQKIDDRLRDCHLMAHGIAKAEVKRNPKSWEKIFENIDQNFCTGGFIHGVVEGLNISDPNFKLDEKVVTEMCENIKKIAKRGADQYCAHISGHILLVEKYASIQEAVQVCDNVPEHIRYQCYGGIFMENITRDNLVEHGVADKIPTNKETMAAQEKICLEHSGLAATGCWREISHMYTVQEKDPLKVWGLCKRAPSEHDEDECYLHAAGLIIRDPKSNEKTYSLLCRPYFNNDKIFTRCLTEMVGTLLNASSKYREQTKLFCSVMPEKYQEICYEKLNSMTRMAPKDD